MHHVDPAGQVKWYWTLYNIPAEVRSLAKNARGIGTLGNNSINGQCAYAPPRSKGPGNKTYVITVYALSSLLDPGLASTAVSREVLLAAMKGKILASAEVQTVYARDGALGEPPTTRP